MSKRIYLPWLLILSICPTLESRKTLTLKLRSSPSMDRRSDKPGEGNGGDREGLGGDMGRRMPSRWSSGSPTNDNQRFPRGGGGFVGGGGGRGGFVGGGGGRGGRFHPYRGTQDYPTGGGGSEHGDFQVPMSGGGGGPMRRGPFGRGGYSDYADGNKFAKLFIGSVPRTATEEDIRPLFEEHGHVVEVALIKDKSSGQQQGFCFIKYATTEEADRAIAALHSQYTLPGASAPLQVRYADGDRERHGLVEDKLFVGSLHKSATEQEIAEIFSPYGHVEDVYLLRDDLKQTRGCGFVKFSNKDMAAAAMNALHGTYVMRGCDQPLIVRFAAPKRPRPDPRGGPAFEGPGFGPRSEASTMIRPPPNLDEPMGGHIPPNTWQQVNPQSNGPSSLARSHGFGSNSAAKSGAVETSSAASSFGDTGGLASNQSNHSATPLSQQGFYSSATQINPVTGQQMLPLQKPFMNPQHLLPSLQQLNNQQILDSHSQAQALQAPMQQLGQLQALQAPQSIGHPSSQNIPSQHFSGLIGQLSTSQPLIQLNISGAGMQNQLGLQQQGVVSIANQQHLPASAISNQLHLRPVQQLPSQIPQVMLQQQQQALQSSFQSSQQAIFQLQQQLQLIQQSGLNQQQVSQNPKQQPPWSGQQSTSGIPASTPACMPSPVSATSSVLVATPSAVPSTCNWTEHTSPEGFKYYYNTVTQESKWEKPEEYIIFEQQQQQKLLLLHQQQQKLAVQHLQTPVQTTSHSQVQSNQQIPQTQQAHSQMQLRQQAQLHFLQPSLVYQAPGSTGHQNVQDFNYAQLQGAGSFNDPSRHQQAPSQMGGQVNKQELSWQSKPAGS